MSEQQVDSLIQRIRSYNWQTWQVRAVEPEYYWYGDGPEYLALAHENEEPLNSYPPVTSEQLRQTEQLLGFPLPSLLRSLYLQVANGGFGPGYAHDMCNEFVEKFLPVLMSPHEPTKEKKQVKARRNRGMRGKTRRRSLDVRSDQEKQTGEATRRSKRIRGRRLIPASWGRC